MYEISSIYTLLDVFICTNRNYLLYISVVLLLNVYRKKIRQVLMFLLLCAHELDLMTFGKTISLQIYIYYSYHVYIKILYREWSQRRYDKPNYTYYFFQDSHSCFDKSQIPSSNHGQRVGRIRNVS